jgi:hypothetical protein
LDGTVPDSIGQLLLLRDLWLGFEKDSNIFAGPLPSSMRNLFKLETLYLNVATLTGPLPDFSRTTLLADCLFTPSQMCIIPEFVPVNSTCNFSVLPECETTVIPSAQPISYAKESQLVENPSAESSSTESSSTESSSAESSSAESSSAESSSTESSSVSDTMAGIIGAIVFLVTSIAFAAGIYLYLRRAKRRREDTSYTPSDDWSDGIPMSSVSGSGMYFTDDEMPKDANGLVFKFLISTGGFGQVWKVFY